MKTDIEGRPIISNERRNEILRDLQRRHELRKKGAEHNHLKDCQGKYQEIIKHSTSNKYFRTIRDKHEGNKYGSSILSKERHLSNLLNKMIINKGNPDVYTNIKEKMGIQNTTETTRYGERIKRFMLDKPGFIQSKILEDNSNGNYIHSKKLFIKNVPFTCVVNKNGKMMVTEVEERKVS